MFKFKITSDELKTVTTTLLFDGENEQLYALKALDKNAHFVPTCNQKVTLSVTGGRILGLGNGDPADISDFSLSTINLFNGKALMIVEKNAEPVTIQVSC